MRSMRIVVVFLACTVASMVQARTVVASVEPLAMLARQMLGDDAEVRTLLRPDQTPHFASFTPSQAREVRDADLLLWLGKEAEPHLAGLLERADARSLALLSVPDVERLDGGHVHTHEPLEHDHDREPGRETASRSEVGTLDPHLWLSPDNMLVLARALATELKLENDVVAAFERDLAHAVERVRTELEPFRERSWLSYHDPWLYFRAAVELPAPLVISEGLQSDTSSRHFAALVRAVEKDQVRCAIAEPEARLSLMRRLCSGDCLVQQLDPLGRDAGSLGYTAFLERLGDKFRQCLAN